MSRTHARWIVARQEHPHIPGASDPLDEGVWCRIICITPDDPSQMPQIMLTEQLAVLDIRQRGQRFTRAN